MKSENHEHQQTIRLRDENESMRRELELRNDTLAAAAHDLRNPLSTIIMALDLFETQSAEHGDHRPLEMARASANYALWLVQELLAVGRAGQQVIREGRVEVSVASLLESVVRQQQLRAARKLITFSTHVVQRIPPVIANPHAVERVLINLIDNAVRETPSRGQVRVAAEAAFDQVIISVSNTGPPPAIEQWERLFEPYVSGIQPGEQRDGLGLGLAIAKRIVDGHGGRMRAHRSTDGLTTFEFTLPAVRREEIA